MQNEPPEDKHDELFNQAIASLNKEAHAAAAAYPNPSAQTFNQTLAALRAAQPVHPTKLQLWRSLMNKPLFQLSATALLAVAITASACIFAFRPAIALAGVIAKIAAVKSVSFKSVGVVSLSGSKQPSTSLIYILAPSKIRVVSDSGRMIAIMDSQAGQMVMLDPIHKTAKIISTAGRKPGSAVNMLERLKNVDARDFDPVGERTIDGRVSAGFRRKNTTAVLPMEETLWIDKQTQLPLEIEISLQTANGPISTVSRDFQWDVPLNESDFSLTPPADYMVSNITMDGSPPAEKDLIDALRAAADLQKNTFPDTLDSAGLLKSATTLKSKLAPASSPAGTDARNNLMPIFTKIFRGLSFIAPKNGSDFHYAGKGVKLNAPNIPIFWYLPTGSTNYHVINADLTIHECTPAEVPTIPSTILGDVAIPTTSPGANR